MYDEKAAVFKGFLKTKCRYSSRNSHICATPPEKPKNVAVDVFSKNIDFLKLFRQMESNPLLLFLVFRGGGTNV